jgi:peroxiredoxin
MKQLVELQSLIPETRRHNTPVVALSSDPIEKIKETIQTVTSRTGGQFGVTMLSDEGHKVIDLYGLRNEEAAKDSGRYIPYPTTYLIDSSGKVRWRFTEKNQAIRPSNEEILAEAAKVW